MKFSLATVLLVVVLVHANAQTTPGYTTKYDSIDIDEILSSKRLVSSYVTCLLNGKPCTPEGTELRNVLPDALKTKCSKCSQKQKDGAIKVMNTLQSQYPDEWKKLSAKWDPTGELFQEFQKETKGQ